MKDPDIMILPYLNEDKFDGKRHKVVSMGSCTTNALAPLIKVLNEEFGIVKGHMTTIHAYTNDQRLLDAIHRDLRRSRAAAVNIVPTSTGAAKAIFQIYPELSGRLSAMAIRVPVPDGSLVDLNVLLERDVSREEVNDSFKEASEGALSESLYYLEDPVVSSDILGLPYLSLFDSLLTSVSDGNLVKVISWYDNEFGYAYHLAKLVSRLFRL
jgi:glyceraldehyde-3-phosphate dehydrogenase type I